MILSLDERHQIHISVAGHYENALSRVPNQALPWGLHLIRRRSSAKTSSAGISLAVPLSISAMRRLISSSQGCFHPCVNFLHDSQQLLGELNPLLRGEGEGFAREFFDEDGHGNLRWTRRVARRGSITAITEWLLCTDQ